MRANWESERQQKEMPSTQEGDCKNIFDNQEIRSQLQPKNLLKRTRG